MRRRILVFLAALVICVSGCSSGTVGGKNKTMDLSVNGHVFSVELADTPDARERGFMERKVIGDDQGMLFVFPDDRRLSFWMENTPHPLSIAYIDSRGIIREIYHMDPYSRKTVQSRVSVRYALEVPRGRFEELGIRSGDRIEFPGGRFPSSRE